MLQFVLFTHRQLSLQELRHALAVTDKIHDEFPCSGKSFEEELIHGIDQRVIHCGGIFLEIKRVYGTCLYGIASLRHSG
jgi:hypothetical protein